MKFFGSDKFSEATMVDPRKLYTDLLKVTSGANYNRSLKYDLFYTIIAFKGAITGVGCSTIVANTAVALASLGLSVCVFDTSIQHPVQDALLKTDYKEKNFDERIDWFDMPFTSQSPLNISKVDRKVSVLSFAGKNRTVLDMLGTTENKELVDIAIDAVKSKFDIILIDLCDELTEVNTTAMQRAQHVIQVWSDSTACLSGLDTTITNTVTLSCPMDKMRCVVENKTCDDVMGGLGALYKQYRFKKLAHCGLSREIARIENMGKMLWQYPTDNEDVIEFTEMIIYIVCHICNIDLDDKEAKGTITTEDIEEGKVEGTLHKKELEEEIEVDVFAPETMEEVENEYPVSDGGTEKKGFFGRRKK